jgi:SulP family sulfate permease
MNNLLNAFTTWHKQHDWVRNIMAAFTVSFIALSLGAAFGVLSGRGAFAGMISAGIIAFFTSAFGGTRVQCSGPTGPMTAVAAVVVATSFDTIAPSIAGLNPDHFINIVFLLSAALLILMGIFRLGKFITYIPNVVISGFMNGIAVIIWLDQIKKLFGLGGKVAYTGDMLTNIVVATITTALVFTLPTLFKKYLSNYSSILSATFVAIVLMTFVANILQLPIEHVALTASITSWSDVTTIVAAQWPTLWTWGIIKLALPFAAQLAILGYLDTLMTSLVIDKMTKEQTHQNKELIAQGMGAGVAALFGGIPGAQATIRSVLIVKEKATTRVAGMLVGIFSIILMLLFQNVINLIPQAVFAGVLIKVGYDVFDLIPFRVYAHELKMQGAALIKKFFAQHTEEKLFVTNTEMVLILGTMLVTVFWDLNAAVALFTASFYLWNYTMSPANKLRDLQPITETESGMQEM